ncbi:hypothetical protein ANN_11256 [Periplaneta americana]|uniref:Uncharacterized protein n=1 Tax=Periplaneta americana TaxID=6978 RepID=A0ABQ8T4H7_PERAM|nr:hypothetical protein ANN_11256 [Periplaneta americana]
MDDSRLHKLALNYNPRGKREIHRDDRPVVSDLLVRVHGDSQQKFPRKSSPFGRDHCIGRGSPKPWPARSPNLNPLDFRLWGLMKKPGQFQRVRDSLCQRAEECIGMNGRGSERLIKEIRREGVCAGHAKLESPGRNRPRESLILVDDMEQCILRRKIPVEEFYTMQKEVPTLKKLLKIARKAINFQGGKETLQINRRGSS